MVDVMLTCEAVEGSQVCEDNITIELENGVVVDERGVSIEAVVPFEDGWAVEYERGCPRLRCPKHAPEPPALTDEDVEISRSASYVWARHKPTGRRESAYYGLHTPEKRAERLARKKLGYAVARQGNRGAAA
jgi:hypothetical protein